MVLCFNKTSFITALSSKTQPDFLYKDHLTLNGTVLAQVHFRISF